MKIKKSETDSRRRLFFFRDHYVFTTLSQIYLGRSHLCKSLILANLGRRKKGLRNTGINVKKEGAKTDPLETPFSRRRSLLCLLSLVVRVKFWFLTSFMIILNMFLSDRSLSSLQIRPRCQVVSYAAVRLTNMALAFFLASKESSMFQISRTT